MVNLVNALRLRQEGFGSTHIRQSLKNVERKNLVNGRAIQHLIKFPDPVLSVMDGYVFTLKQVLRCWDLYTKELKWQFPSVGALSCEQLIPVFKLNGFVLCANANRGFKVLSLDHGQVVASVGIPYPLYESIHQIGELIIIKRQDNSSFEFNWKENKMIQLDDTSPVKQYIHTDYSSFPAIYKELEMLGFSQRSHSNVKSDYLSIFRADNLEQLDKVSKTPGQQGFAVNHNKVFKLIEKRKVEVFDCNTDISQVIYEATSYPSQIIDHISIRDDCLVLEIGLFFANSKNYLFFDKDTYEQITTINITDAIHTEENYIGLQTSTRCPIVFQNGFYTRIFGSYLEVIDFKHLQSETNNSWQVFKIKLPEVDNSNPLDMSGLVINDSSSDSEDDDLANG